MMQTRGKGGGGANYLNFNGTLLDDYSVHIEKNSRVKELSGQGGDRSTLL